MNRPPVIQKSDDDAHLLIGRGLGQTYRRSNKTEPYVTVPPALLITDSDGAVWTLGFRYQIRNGIYELNVLRNDIDFGEMASRIEYRDGIVRIFGHDYGRKVLSRNRRFFL